MKKFNVLIPALVGMAAFFLFAFAIPQDQKKGGPWQIPDKYAKMTNPTKDVDASLATGKMLWGKFCKSCHGNIGKGDGPKAAMLKTFPGDFTTAEFKKQTDGTLYYQSFIGRDEMPNFESKIPEEEDRWAVINYLKTFK
jgi:mono/diheme cytochrome c family protein